MSEKNIESTKPVTEQVKPIPATPVESATVQTPVTEVATPVVSTTEKPAAQGTDQKAVSAFVKQRQQIRDLKKALADVEAAKLVPQQPAAAPVVTPVVAPQQPVTKPVVQPQVAESGVDDEVKAIQAMAADSDVRQVPGAIMEILELVDTDPKLAKLDAIDHSLALREAKAIWASRLGIAPAQVTPVVAPVSGGMGTTNEDLDSLMKSMDGLKPGTKAFRDAVSKVNQAMARK